MVKLIIAVWVLGIAFGASGLASTNRMLAGEPTNQRLRSRRDMIMGAILINILALICIALFFYFR